MSLFRNLDRADLVARSRAFAGTRWLTWSYEFRELLARNRRWAKELAPRLIYLSSKREYAYTYSVSLRRVAPSRFGGELQPFVDDLLSLDPGPRVLFMSELSCREEGWT